MLAGKKDALGLMGLSSGFMASSPLMASQPELAIPSIASASAGASWLLYKNLKRKAERVDTVSRSRFILPSDPTPDECFGLGGLRLGFTTDDHRPLDIDNDLSTRHLCVIGSTGVGKTVLGEYMMAQQMARGGGILFIDAKLDKDTRDKMAWMCDLYGRRDDLLVLNTADPQNSNSYNPVLYGEGDEVSSRLLNLLPLTEGSAGADHYKQQANIAIANVINALKAAAYRYHFGDLTLLLQSTAAMNELRRVVPQGSPEARALEIFLDQYRSMGKGGVADLDMKRLKETFGGIAGRIALFAQGGFAKTFCTYTPEIDLYDAIVNNKIVYIMLPTMAKDTAAINLGKMIISDLRTAAARVQELTKSKRPNPPFLCFLDEYGSYATASASALAEQARSAGIMLCLAFQSTANLKTVGPDFADKVLQNTWTKVFFRFGNNDDSDYASELIGKTVKFSESLGGSESEGASSPLTNFSAQIQESDSEAISRQFRETEAYRVTPEQLRGLQKGQAVVYTEGQMYHIKIPLLHPSKGVRIPEFKAYRRHYSMPKSERPLDFEKNYTKYMSIGEKMELIAQQKKAKAEDESKAREMAA